MTNTFFQNNIFVIFFNYTFDDNTGNLREKQFRNFSLTNKMQNGGSSKPRTIVSFAKFIIFAQRCPKLLFFANLFPFLMFNKATFLATLITYGKKGEELHIQGENNHVVNCYLQKLQMECVFESTWKDVYFILTIMELLTVWFQTVLDLYYLMEMVMGPSFWMIQDNKTLILRFNEKMTPKWQAAYFTP